LERIHHALSVKCREQASRVDHQRTRNAEIDRRVVWAQFLAFRQDGNLIALR